jgi:hypothetical protein
MTHYAKKKPGERLAKKTAYYFSPPQGLEGEGINLTLQSSHTI